jgi:hypothetical protein
MAVVCSQAIALLNASVLIKRRLAIVRQHFLRCFSGRNTLGCSSFGNIEEESAAGKVSTWTRSSHIRGDPSQNCSLDPTFPRSVVVYSVFRCSLTSVHSSLPSNEAASVCFSVFTFSPKCLEISIMLSTTLLPHTLTLAAFSTAHTAVWAWGMYCRNGISYDVPMGLWL